MTERDTRMKMTWKRWLLASLTLVMLCFHPTRNGTGEERLLG